MLQGCPLAYKACSPDVRNIFFFIIIMVFFQSKWKFLCKFHTALVIFFTKIRTIYYYFLFFFKAHFQLFQSNQSKVTASNKAGHIFLFVLLWQKNKRSCDLSTVHYLHFALIMLQCLCVQSAVLNIHITVSALMYCGTGKLVPADRLDLDQTLNTMFVCFFVLPFLFGPRIAEQSAARLLCLFGVNEWCVKHLEWCMVSSGELTWGSCLLNKPTVW